MMGDIFAKDLSDEIVSPDKPGYDELITSILATIKTATETNTGYRTREEVHEYTERILDEGLDATTTVLSPLYIDYDKPVNIGERYFIQQYYTFFRRGGITVGDDVFIGPKVNLIAINHDSDPDNRSTIYGRSIVIENKVWIGINSTILPGVGIGCGAIVEVGSVATKNVPAMTIVAGNPAWIIKKIKANE